MGSFLGKVMAELSLRREARERMGSPEKGKVVYQEPGERQPLRG